MFKILIKIFSPLFLIVFFDVAWAYSVEFEPSQRPLVYMNSAKPNILLVIDTGWGMTDLQDAGRMYVSEHTDGFGLPICDKPTGWATTVRNARQSENDGSNGEEVVKLYDPFSTGKYIPYNPMDHVDSNGSSIYTDSIPVDVCKKRNKILTLNGVTKDLVRQLSQEAYIGIASYGRYDPVLASAYAKGQDLSYIGVPIMNLSEQKDEDFEKFDAFIDKVATDDYVLNNNFRNNAPMLNTVYQLGLYFRGYPIGNQFNVVPRVKIENNTTQTNVSKWEFKQYPNPAKYRCTQNHMVLLTNGWIEGEYILPILKSDAQWDNEKYTGAKDDSKFWYYHSIFPYISQLSNSSDDGLFFTNNYRALGWGAVSGNDYSTVAMMLNRDMRLKENRASNFPLTDASGKDWFGKGSIPQNVRVDAITFSPNSPFYGYSIMTQGLSGKQPVGGTNGIFTKGTQTNGTNEVTSSDSVRMAFDEILKDQIGSLSSTHAVEDQSRRTKDTIRYKSKYNIHQRTSVVEAYEWDVAKNDWKSFPRWTTNEKLKGAQGRLLTMSYPVKDQWKRKSIYAASMYTAYLNNAYKASYGKTLIDRITIYLWGMMQQDSASFRSDARVHSRPVALGANVHSNLAYFAKDKPYFNLQLSDKTLKKEMNHYIARRSLSYKTNLIITNTNDGIVNFIYAAKGLSNNKVNSKEGTRYAAYFPGFLAQRLDEIALKNRPFIFTMDGPINLFDFKHNVSQQDKISTVGYSAMGAGGKGLVAYRIFETTLNGTDVAGNPRFIYDNKEITPLFEIANEGVYKMPGFENLGYTYSDFEFFNRSYNGRIEGVAVFGNGWGTNVSSLYLINAYTGELLQEVILNGNGGGASSPAIVVEKDSNGYQKIVSAYVGDTSGYLYKVTFNEDLSHNVDILFKPSTEYNPITTKPMIIKNRFNQVWVYFGTGRNADEIRDRGKNAKITQYIYGIKDKGKTGLERFDLGENQMVIGEDSTVSVQSYSTSENGWFIPLDNNGERIILSPAKTEDAVVFVTWGNNEMELFSENDPNYDPCIGDETYGKIIFLSQLTGKTEGNKGSLVTAGAAPGIPTSPSIDNQSDLSGGGLGQKSVLDEDTQKDVTKDLGLSPAYNPPELSESVDTCAISTGDHGYDFKCIDIPNMRLPNISIKPSRTSLIRLL